MGGMFSRTRKSYNPNRTMSYTSSDPNKRGFNDWGRKSEGGGFLKSSRMFKSSKRMFNRGMTRLTRSAYSRHHRKRLKR